MKQPDAGQALTAAQLISEIIAGLGDWRGETLARMRKLFHDADPRVIDVRRTRRRPMCQTSGQTPCPAAAT